MPHSDRGQAIPPSWTPEMKVTKLEPHQERVLAEHGELRDRVRRLSIFLAGAESGRLGVGEIRLMQLQLAIMRSYQEVLELRIVSWTSGG